MANSVGTGPAIRSNQQPVSVGVNFTTQAQSNTNSTIPVNSTTNSLLNTGGRTFPSVQVIPTPPLTFANDSINLLPTTTETNVGQYDNALNKRPDIVFTYDFQSPASNTVVGKFVDFNYEARILRENMLFSLLSDISSSAQTSQDFQTFSQEVERSLTVARTSVQNLELRERQVDAIKETLQVKLLPETRNLYTQRLQFLDSGWSGVSPTKVIGQFLLDAQASLDSYSLNLLNLNDPDRRSSDATLSYDLSFTNNQTFKVDSIRSATNVTNACRTVPQNVFYSLLPTNADDRIKLLISFLCKEVVVSKNLSDTQVRQKLLDYYGIPNVGSPFNNIFGTTGESVFSVPQGQNSIFSLLRDGNILPFEQELQTDQTTNKLLIPGAEAYFEGTYSSNDLTTLRSYLSRIEDVLTSAEFVVEKLLSFGSTLQSRLNPNIFLKNLFQNLQAVNQQLVPTSQQAILMTAIFRLAASDFVLKKTLFQFLVLVGIANSERNGNLTNQPLFVNVIKELQTLDGLEIAGSSFPDLATATSSNLSSFIFQVAQKIEKRILGLLGFATTENVPSSIPVSGQDAAGIYSYNPRTIASSLVFMSTRPNQAVANPVQMFFNLVNAVDVEMQNQPSYILDDGTTRTRFNFISTSHLLLTLYELTVTSVKKFLVGDFQNTTSTSQTTVKVLLDQTQQTAIQVSLDRAATNNYFRGQQQTQYDVSILSIRNDISQEYDFYISVFPQIRRFFSETYQRGGTQFINFIQGQPGAASFRLNREQRRVARNYLDALEQQKRESGLFVSKLVNPAERLAMLGWLGDSTLSSPVVKDKVKIVCVGIPKNFIHQTLTLRTKKNLIKVKVYKKSHLFPTVVWKPLTFSFNPNWFYASPLPTAMSEELTGFQLKDLTSPTTTRTVSFDEVSGNEAREAFLNTVKSELLNKYMLLTTGLTANESDFTLEEGPTTSSNSDSLVRLVKKYLKDVKRLQFDTNVTVDQLLRTDTALTATEKDQLKLLTQSNVIMRSDIINHKTLSDKHYDRVFNILLDERNFVVDEQQTPSEFWLTTQSQEFFEQNQATGERKLKENTKFFVEDLFIVLEG